MTTARDDEDCGEIRDEKEGCDPVRSLKIPRFGSISPWLKMMGWRFGGNDVARCMQDETQQARGATAPPDVRECP